jgi:energy-coupling factor transporter ATP-binding protein EcfA2
MKLIGLNGSKGSGKSTLAAEYKKFLDHNYQRQCYVASFAAPLKKACYELFGGHLDNYYGSDEQKNQATPYWKEKLGYVLDENGKKKSAPGFDNYRQIMQTIGTQLFRDCLAQDFWIYVMEQNFNAAKQGFNSVFIVDDVRFENEAQWIHKNGGHIYMLEPTFKKPGKIDTHLSEKPLPDTIPVERVSFNNITEMKEYIKTDMYPFIQHKLEDVK